MKDKLGRCLVVDDEDLLRGAIVKTVGRAGYECFEASNGEEALRVMEFADIDIVLSDIHMPVMDGRKLLKELTRRYPHTAVIMITSVSEVEIAVDCLKFGAFDYLTKPFQLEEIGARMRQALVRRSLVAENERYQNDLAELVHEQAQRIEHLYLEGIQSLVHALEAKDNYTSGHSARVSAYCRWIAERLGVSSGQLALIALGAELHDAGKIGVKESVLLKPSRLTEEEYEHIKQHTIIGEHILKPLLNDAPEILEIVRSHHERLDGNGFPDGLSAYQIPQHVRIVTVADTFDAMTSGRPYRPGRSAELALQELQRCKGSQFDPDVVDAFVAAASEADEFPVRTPESVKHMLPQALAAAPIPAPPG